MSRLLPALALAIATLLPLGASAQASAALSGFVASDLDDKPARLAIYNGQPLLINFWARWCAPCRKEIPDLVAIDAKYRGQGLVIVGLALEERDHRQAVRDFAARLGVAYPVLLTGTSKGIELMAALGNDKSALPFTVVIDRQGKVLTRKIGGMSRAEMEAAIAAALN